MRMLSVRSSRFSPGPPAWLCYNLHGLDDEGWGPVGSRYRLVYREQAPTLVLPGELLVSERVAYRGSESLHPGLLVNLSPRADHPTDVIRGAEQARGARRVTVGPGDTGGRIEAFGEAVAVADRRGQ